MNVEKKYFYYKIFILISVTFYGSTDNSNKGLINPYTFLYIIIILTCRKIYFRLYTVGKKKNYEKFNIFTCHFG